MGAERPMQMLYQSMEDGLAVASDPDAMEFIISDQDMLVVSPDKKVKKEDPVGKQC